MHTHNRVVISNMRIQQVQVEDFKEYKKRVASSSWLVNIDKVYWKVLLLSPLSVSVIPPLFPLCLLYLPVALITKPLVNKEYKRLYEYQRRIQTVATNSAGVKPIELRNKKGAGE